MDAAASKWTGMRAAMRSVRYSALLDDERVEQGRIVVRRVKSGSVEMLVSFDDPYEYYVSVAGAKIRIYKPKIKTVEEYDAGDQRDRLETGLLLGFGTAGSYLQQHYEIELQGDEDITGQPAVKLALKPRDPDQPTNNRPLEMWVSTTSWQALQMKIYDVRPGDYRLSSYSEVEMNPSFKNSEFKFKQVRGTRTVRPQL